MIKLTNKIFVIIFFVFILSIPLYAEKAHDGQQLFLYGSSAAALGRGGTGVSCHALELFYLNPATIASLERVGVSINYGDLANGYIDPAITFAFPTSYGIFSAYFRRVAISEEDTLNIETGIQGGIGAAKKITTNFSLGIMYNFFQTTDALGSQYYHGGTLGFIYKVPFMVYSRSGFGIYEPGLGFSVNAGFSGGDNKEDADLTQITVGYNVDLFRNSSFSLGIFNDLSFKNDFKEHPVKIGAQSIIKSILILRVGAVYPDEYEYGGYTLGAGLRFEHDYFAADINYAFVNYEDKQFVHYLGLNFLYGELDREPPQVKIKPSEKYISPNYDGIKDFVSFDINVTDRSMLKGWRLQIIDENNDIIKTFKISERDIEEEMGPIIFFKKIWQKKESAVVPDKIIWDGTNIEGKIVKDGIYKYSFIAWDERNNYSFKKEGKIVVDNTRPAVDLKTKEKLFSPNNDNNKDFFTINQKFITEDYDKWEAGFTDDKGKIVKFFHWEGKHGPKILKWDGRDNNGKELPEGLYDYYIKCVDLAGNFESQKIKEISLFRRYELIDVTCSNEFYSYKKDKIVLFRPLLSSNRGLKNWQIVVEDEDQDIVKIFKGKDSLPIEIEWEVKDNENKNLSDGIYYYYLKAVYVSGNNPIAYKKRIIVDSTAPDIDLDFSPKVFTPDGDGENDVLTIETEANDEFGIKEWSIVITNPTGYFFKAFSGYGKPGKILKWDGLGHNDELVESANNYFISLRVTDNAGNTSLLEKKRLPIGVLVVVTERGLKIRINNIEFAFNSAKLTGKAEDILDKVVDILERYKVYNIAVEGHTDDIGEEDYNLSLSEKRAKAVYEYLIDEGIDEQRLTFRGLGETAPFVPNKDKESRRKNRRVEFILVKKDKGPKKE